ncbi:MAG: enoyl-CoA hydratase/isomerase family protein [Acidobacteria bacterium]|nr:MAG: enoyl-CoA hydratase/isomerase family protein [Acidobacteriota bacterium]
MSDSAPEYRHLMLEMHPHWAVVRLHRPHALNTLSIATLEELTRAFDGLGRRPDMRAVILTGSGEAFAAGADIREVAALNGLDALAFAERGQRLCRLIERCPSVVIAAIDGYCFGGGLDVAMACHLRYASARSLFAHPGARIGIMTGFGGTWRLPRLVGKSRALELFLTGKRLTAQQALAWGLIHRVITQGSVVEAAKETAMRLINRSSFTS